MKYIFITFTLFLFSFVASAKETWVVKDMPEVKYLFRAAEGNLDGTKGGAKALELVAEAKKYNLIHSKTVFYKLDLQKKTTLEAGLEVSGPNLSKVPANLLRARPAGKYLIGHYLGKQNRKLFKSIIPTYKKKKLTAKDTTVYMYSKFAGTDKATLLLVLPLK